MLRSDLVIVYTDPIQTDFKLNWATLSKYQRYIHTLKMAIKSVKIERRIIVDLKILDSDHIFISHLLSGKDHGAIASVPSSTVIVLTAGVSPPRVFFDFPSSYCVKKKTNKKECLSVTNSQLQLTLRSTPIDNNLQHTITRFHSISE